MEKTKIEKIIRKANVKDDKHMIISHNDADGLVSVVVHMIYYKHVVKKSTTDMLTVISEASDVMSRFAEAVVDFGFLPKKITVTDVSFNKDDIDVINILTEKGVEIELFDHHKTALWMKDQYDWAHVTEDAIGACEFYYNHLQHQLEEHGFDTENLKQLIHYTSYCDTGRSLGGNYPKWYEYPSILAKRLSAEFFVQEFTEICISNTKEKLFPTYMDSIYEKYVDQRNNYAKSASRLSKLVTINGHKIYLTIVNINATFFGEMYNNTYDITGVLYLDTRSLSLRTKKPGLNLGTTIQTICGDKSGGHMKAAGGKLTDSQISDILQQFFKG